MTRSGPALAGPPSRAGLARFPRWTLPANRVTYRAHSTKKGAWFFHALEHDEATDGRFDLPAPEGTCYLAGTMPGAVRERWGRNLVSRGYILARDADTTQVSSLSVPRPHGLANTSHRRAAECGLTREIATITPYRLPQEWAAAFRSLPSDGIRYLPRFSTGPRDVAYALFGEAGPRTWPVDAAPMAGRQAAHQANIRVLDPPVRVTIVSPPA